MANHGYAVFRDWQTADLWSPFSAAAWQAAQDRFGIAVTRECPEPDVVRFRLNDPDSGWVAAIAEFWLRDATTVEWPHRLERLDWWFTETIAAKAARAVAAASGVSAVILDDGIEEEEEPGFDLRFPRYADWKEEPFRSLRASLDPVSGFMLSAAVSIGRLFRRTPGSLELILDDAPPPVAAGSAVIPERTR